MMRPKQFRICFALCVALCCSAVSGLCGVPKGEPHVPTIMRCKVLPDSLAANLVIVSVRDLVSKNGTMSLSDGNISRSGFRVICQANGGYTWFDTADPLTQALDMLPQNRNTLVYVHGYGHGFYSMARVGARIASRYGINVILFDWPSKSLNLPKVIDNVSGTASIFGELLGEVELWHSKRLNRGLHLSLMLHSLGNEYLLETIKQHKFNAYCFSSIILNSSAISCTRYDSTVCQSFIGSRVYVVQNPNDRVLKWTRRLLSNELLGNSRDLSGCTNATSLNFEKVVGREHTYFLGNTEEENQNPIIFKVYNRLVNGYRLDSMFIAKKRA